MPFLLAILLCLVLTTGCAPSSGRPVAVSPLPIVKKHEFIRQSKTTLKNFQSAAADLRSRRKSQPMREFAGEVKRYMDLQVAPIVADFAAGHDLQTRLEVAKLQLLGSLVYVELADYRQAAHLLTEMDRRYGNQPDILSAALDRKDVGFATIGDGLQSLRERIEREEASLPRLFNLPALPRI